MDPRGTVRTYGLLWIAIAVLSASCVHKYKVPEPTSAQHPISGRARGVLVTPENGRDDRGASYPGSGGWVASALSGALRYKGVEVSIAPAPAELGTLLASAREQTADALVVPEIRSWSDRLTEWSGIPDRITIRIQVFAVADGKLLDDREIRASSRWATFGGDHPQDLLPELSARWAESVVAAP